MIKVLGPEGCQKAMEYYHLDKEYRARWQLYHLTDGRVYDSRKTNWRLIEWEKVIKVETYIRNQKHVVDCFGKTNFRGMMCFRWAGGTSYKKTIRENGKVKLVKGNQPYRKVNLWTVGWTDGVNCYLSDIDRTTGYKLNNYVAPVKQFSGHIHPRLALAKYI